jgi:CheY-like chemotaxis protein
MTKILLVEDDKSLREIYGVRLLAEGYDIISAGDGEQALAMAIKERPALIVSDVMMPKISGFDMLDILRSTTETKNIKVIMMTALSSEDQRQRGESLGADRYLVKSQVGIEDVVRTVHDVLGDAPVNTPSPVQTFSSTAAPAPSPASRPAPVIPPRPIQAPPAPSFSPQPQPVAAPTPITPQPPLPRPQIPPASAATAPQPQTPEPPSLPQPTAPFSTARPANLGDRIIHPLSNPDDTRDFSSLIDQELNKPAPTAPTFTPAAEPVAPPAAAPQPQPTPSFQPPVNPQPARPPQGPSPADISFEETPRPSAPPYSGMPPQPPAAS